MFFKDDENKDLFPTEEAIDFAVSDVDNDDCTPAAEEDYNNCHLDDDDDEEPMDNGNYIHRKQKNDEFAEWRIKLYFGLNPNELIDDEDEVFDVQHDDSTIKPREKICKRSVFLSETKIGN